MDNLIKLHYRFDTLSISYAQFITFIHDNGIPPQQPKFKNDNVQLFVEVGEELATVMKLTFGYFQIKVKSPEELAAEESRRYAELMKYMKEDIYRYADKLEYENSYAKKNINWSKI